MTDENTTTPEAPVAPVVELKPKTTPKAKPQTGKHADPFGLDGTPFAGSHNPGTAAQAYDRMSKTWNGWNQQRSEEGVLGLDGLLIEAAFQAAATGAKEDVEALEKLAHYVKVSQW